MGLVPCRFYVYLECRSLYMVAPNSVEDGAIAATNEKMLLHLWYQPFPVHAHPSDIETI
jgi:hypothetical protein